MLSGPASNNLQKSCGLHLVVSLNYSSQNGGNLYRAPYYNGNPNIGPIIIGKKDQYPPRLSCQQEDTMRGLELWGMGILDLLESLKLMYFNK